MTVLDGRLRVAALTTEVTPALQSLIEKYSDGKIVQVPVDKMYEDFNVRQAPFDEERVSLFRGHYDEEPNKVFPVFVEKMPDGRYRILDGRTRHAGAELSGIKTIRALVFVNVSVADRNHIAAISNLRQAREMKQTDLKRLFDNLLDANVTEAQIRFQYAGILPKGTIYAALQISSRDRRKRVLRLAKRDVHNSTLCQKDAIKQVAKKWGIKPARLRQALLGSADSMGDTTVDAVARGEAGDIGVKFAHFKQSVTKTAQRWNEKFGTEELEPEAVTDLYAKARMHAKEVLALIDNAEQKFKNILQNEGITV